MTTPSNQHRARRSTGPVPAPAPGLPAQPGVLRGRAAELARLDALITAARAGAGEIVVVEGAAGIGKSRLLAEARQRAAQGSLLVAASAADELDQVTPWGPLLRALSSADPRLLDPGELDALRSMSDQRLAVIERMRAALEVASMHHPLLIALDDLQWADSATLLALGVLPGELFSYPVAWLLSRRPLPSAPALEGLLARLDEAGAIRLHVGPLDAADAAALAADVAGPVPGADLAGLIAGAEGNPFYIIELLRAASLAHRRGAAEVTPELPAAARAAVASHLRSLSDPARQLLSVASVLGRDFSVAELAEMTGQPASRLLPALEEALAAEVFTELSDRMAFRHDLLRQAVYASLAASARLALHRDAAQALRRTGAPKVRIAGQLAIGAQPGDTAAIRSLGEAARELLPTSPRAAADLAARALELLGERDDGRHELVLTAVRGLALAGRRSAAVEVAERSLARHELPAPVEAALQLELRAAWVFERLQAYPSALPARLLTDPGVDPTIIATAVACEHAGQMWDGSGQEADHAFDQALAIVAGSGLAFELSVIAFLRVVNSMLRGRMAEALQRAEAARAGAKTLEQHSSGTHEALVAVALGANGRYRDALAILRAGLAAAESSGRTYFIIQCRWLQSFQLLQLGRLEDAHAEARAVVEAADDFGYAGHRSHGLAILAETALRQGDGETAFSALARFGPPAQTGPLPDRYWAAALVADALGDRAGVAQALQPLRAQLDLGCYATAISQHHRLPQLIQIAYRAGDDESAAAFARSAAVLAEQNPHVDSLAAAGAHARGLVQHDAGLLRQAVRRATVSDSLLVEAAAREDLALLLAGQTHQPEAIDQLEAAYASYVQAGAHRDTARVRAALRSLGVRKRQTSIARPQQGWQGLTRSERAVVDLVASGLTNREAASALFLSPDTINTHLRHAFAKLGIRSRVELARIAAGHTRAPS